MRYVVSGSFPGSQQMQLQGGMQAVPIQQVQRVLVQQAPAQPQSQSQQMNVGYVIKQAPVAQPQQVGAGGAGSASAPGVAAQRLPLQYQAASMPGVAAPGGVPPTDASQQRPQLHLVPTGHAPHLAPGQMIATRTATLPAGVPTGIRFTTSVQPTALPVALPVQQPAQAIASDGSMLFAQQSTQLLPVTHSMASSSAIAQQQAAGGPLRVLPYDRACRFYLIN